MLMKNSAHISIFLLAVGMMVLAGCDPTFETNGRKVKFTAVSNSSPSTKTSYGTLDNGYQMIAWTSNTDKIRIYCPDDENGGVMSYNGNGTDWAVTDPDNPGDEYGGEVTPTTWEGTNDALGLDYLYADYKIATVTSSFPKSSASLENVDPNGLIWTGTENATFYGAYPNDIPIGSINSGAVVNDNPVYNLCFELTIPAGKTGSVTTGQTGDPADVKNMPLLAINSNVKHGSDVSLNFYPAFSAFEFHLKSANEVNLTINSFELSTPTSGTQYQYLTGRCYYDLNKLTDNTSTDYDKHYLPNNQIRFVEGSKSLKIDVNKQVTSSSEASFTLFTLPCTFNQLSIRVWYTPAGSTTQKTKSLALTKNGQFISFPAGHKARILGLALTEDLWKIFFEVDVDKWEELDPVTIEL